MSTSESSATSLFWLASCCILAGLGRMARSGGLLPRIRVVRMASRSRVASTLTVMPLCCLKGATTALKESSSVLPQVVSRLTDETEELPPLLLPQAARMEVAALAERPRATARWMKARRLRPCWVNSSTRESTASRCWRSVGSMARASICGDRRARHWAPAVWDRTEHRRAWRVASRTSPGARSRRTGTSAAKSVPAYSHAAVMPRMARLAAAPSLDFAWVWWGRKGDGEGEGGALARGAIEGDGAAVALDDLAGDVEAKTQADAGAILVLGAG